MRLVSKCNTCGTPFSMNGVRCQNTMLNGCNKKFCYVCWPDHAKIHESEWDEMTEAEKDKLVEEYNANQDNNTINR